MSLFNYDKENVGTNTKAILDLINTNQEAIGTQLNRLNGRLKWIEENLKANGFIKEE